MNKKSQKLILNTKIIIDDNVVYLPIKVVKPYELMSQNQIKA